MEKYDLMKLHVNKWLGSGKSMLDYCRENNLPYEGFRHWRRKLVPWTLERRTSTEARLIPLEIRESAMNKSVDFDISLCIQKDGEIVIRLRSPR